MSDWRVKLLLDQANKSLGFGPSLPSNFNYVGNQNALAQLIDYNSAIGANVRTEAFDGRASKGRLNVSVYAAPLKPNRLDARRTGILYCVRDLVSGVYDYRIVIREQHDPDYIREFGIFRGKVKETKHKFFDCSFDQGWRTVLKKENRRAYDAVRSAMTGTPTLFAQAKVWLHDGNQIAAKQVALTKASSKSVSDTLKLFWQTLKAEVQKLWNKLKKDFVNALVKALKKVAKDIWCNLSGGLFCQLPPSSVVPGTVQLNPSWAGLALQFAEFSPPTNHLCLAA